MKGKITICLLALLIFSGCAWSEAKKEKTAEELVSEGMDFFNNGKYHQSIEVFEKLRDFYPFSKYAILAELKVADAYFKSRAYENAIYAYEEFENLHPRNEATPYVVNQIGLCYFRKIDSVDRDQVAAQKALDTFQRLVDQFPDSTYVNRAKENIIKCQKSLAGHELEVGLYYFKNKLYKAAIHRFKTVLTDYPDVGEIHHQALQFIALSEKSLKAQATEE